jgi:hypothetical protein
MRRLRNFAHEPPSSDRRCPATKLRTHNREKKGY